MSFFSRNSKFQNSSERVADEVAAHITLTFSQSSFERFFDNEELADGWSKDDALGVWYALGNLALAIASWSTFKGESHKAKSAIDLVRPKLLQRWNMSRSSASRMFSFVNEREYEAFHAFHSCRDGGQLASFFGHYVSNVLGSTVSITTDSSFENLIRGVRARQIDPITNAVLAETFVTTITALRELLKNLDG